MKPTPSILGAHLSHRLFLSWERPTEALGERITHRTAHMQPPQLPGSADLQMVYVTSVPLVSPGLDTWPAPQLIKTAPNLLNHHLL